MLIEPLFEKLTHLRLTGMKEALKEQLERGPSDLTFEERVALLVEREWLMRDNKKLSRRLKTAKFKQSACIENINFRHPRGIEKPQIMELAQCRWVTDHRNLVITGPTGTGKTYLACALAHQSCLKGFSSRYYRLPQLLRELQISRADGSYDKTLLSLAKIDVLIIDDWGLAEFNNTSRRDLLELIDDRYQLRSTIITSQLPIGHWHEYIAEATIADAILDRVVHQSVKIQLKVGAKSMRNEEEKLYTEEVTEK